MAIELENARRFGPRDYDRSFARGQIARYEAGIYANRVEWVERYLGPRCAGLWLDAGSGLGDFGAAVRSRGGRVVGLDFSAELLDASRERWSDSVVLRGDVEALPFVPQRFDGVLALDVLEHLLDPAAFLAQLARVAKRGARLLLSTDNARSPSRWKGLRRLAEWRKRRSSLGASLDRVRREFPSPSCHVRLYTPRETMELVSRAGFRIVRWDTFPRHERGWIARGLASGLAAGLARGWRGGELILEATREENGR